ncbi:reverse transcriptase domain-containing protein [Tanacetum coccineum]
MKRFENVIFKQRDVINDIMAEMFGLLKELSTSRTPKKVFIREEARHPITKNINSISVIQEEEEKNEVNNRAIIESIMKPSNSEEEEWYRIFTKGQKRSQTRQNRARERKEHEEKTKSEPKVKKSKSTPTKVKVKDGAEIEEKRKERAKVDVIAKLPPPTSVKGIRSFLGHAGFYRRFIQDFSKIARPMTYLLEKETPFIFSTKCREEFKTLKKKLTEAPILVAPDWDLPFEIMCDASDFAVEAVLGQRKTKHFQPIHYESKTMTDAHAHYTTTEKELLAVVYAFEKF